MTKPKLSHGANGSAAARAPEPDPLAERQQAAERARTAAAALDTIETGLIEISDWCAVAACGLAGLEEIEAEHLARLDRVLGLLDQIAEVAGGRKAMLAVVRAAQAPLQPPIQ